MTIRINFLLPFLFVLHLLAGPALAQTPAVDPTASGPAASRQASEALIQILKDPVAREALIETLEAQAAAAPSGDGAGDGNGAVVPPADGSQAPAEEAGNGFVLQVGEYTRSLADDAGMLVERAGHALNGLVLVMRGDIPINWQRVWSVVAQVVMVLAAAHAAFLFGQFLAGKSYPKLALKARYGGGLARTLILLLTTVIDALSVGLGLGVGYFVALVAYGGFETGVTLQESLALNAFFIAGMANVALRFVFAPRRPELRLLPFDDASADYWYRRLRLYMIWNNYGIFLAVPMANLAVSFVLGNALRVLVILAGMVFLVVLVLRNRTRVRDGAQRYADSLQSSVGQWLVTSLGRLWHIGALGYIIAIFVIWIIRPFDATTIILRATGLSIVTIMAGMALSLIMTRAIRGGLRLPESVNQSLPALQHRLNAFVPRILKIVRSVVFLATVLLILDIWGVLGVVDWLASETGARLIGSYGSAVLVLLVAFSIWLGLMSWVDLRLQSRRGHVVTARERTLFQLFRNAATVVIMVMAALLSLSEIGVDIGPLIAGAGVVGLAISFGAQTLVKDIITGAFIQIENAINEGDVVTVAGTTGTVEGITVRSVRIRDLNGTTHLIPFSSVDMVSNFMRGFSYHVALIGVSYDTDITVAKDAMKEAFRRLRETDFGAKIFDDLEMHGVTNFGASSIDIRARIKTSPGDQWSVGRAYNEFVKQVFDERGIEIPFPQVTYHAGQPPFADTPKNAAKSLKAPDGPKALADDAPPEGDADK